MPLTTQGRNDLLTNGLTAFTHAGAYEDLGSTETSGGSYARQAITWNAASGGIRNQNGGLTIPIAAGKTIQVVSIHSASSAGNLEAWLQIGSTLRGAANVLASSDVITSYAHGLTTDDRIFIQPVLGDSLPTGGSVSTLYFVLAAGLTADVFSISTTSGGGAVNFTTNGEFYWAKTVPNAFASAGNLTIATTQLAIDLTQL